jgi:hypothetical protein
VSSPRDPRRSLILGTLIAAVVLVLLALFVLVGIVIVFMPRRAGRDAVGPTALGPHVVAIHLLPVPPS